MQENLTSINALVLLGLTAGQAMAGTVQLTQPNPITTNGATTLNPNLVGTLFTDGGPSLAGIQSVDGAAFAFSWGPTVLQYTGSVVSDPNWDIAVLTPPPLSPVAVLSTLRSLHAAQVSSDRTLTSLI